MKSRKPLWFLLVTVPFVMASAFEAEPFEKELFVLLNKERVQRDLPPLDPDPELATVARAHSADMIENKFFEHTSPNNGTVQDRIFKAKLAAGATGENIAKNMTVALAHVALMKSPGHRANILSPDFDHVGIGIVSHPDGSIMITQDFRKAMDPLTGKPAARKLFAALNAKRAEAHLPKLRVSKPLVAIAKKIVFKQNKEQRLLPDLCNSLLDPKQLALQEYSAWVGLAADYQRASQLEAVTNPRINAVGLWVLSNETQEKGLGMLWICVLLARVPAPAIPPAHKAE
jgi:uncharacterized protein YkwD